MKGGAGHEGTRARPRPARSLLFSFMNVHMSRSSGLCAKEQFPTYWHLRPFCAWMQSCGGRGEPPGSLWIIAAPAGEHAPPGPHGTPGQGRTAPAPHAGTHVVLLWEVANGWQWPHRHPFPLGLGHHQKDPPLLGPAAGQRRGPVREGSSRASGYVTSTERRPPRLWCSRGPRPRPRPRARSPVPGLGAAVLEVFVWLHHLPIPPALAAHKLHLQVKGAGPMCP